MTIALFMLSVPFMVLALRFDQKARAHRDDSESTFPVISWAFLTISLILMYYASGGDLLTIAAMLVANVSATAVTMLYIIPSVFKEKS